MRSAAQESDGPRQSTKSIPPQLQRCVQRIVQNVRKQVTQQHVDGFDLKDSFGSLHVLCTSNLFSDLMRRHNDPEDAYHFRLFEFVVLGSQVSPERLCVDDSQSVPRNYCWLGIPIEWRCHYGR